MKNLTAYRIRYDDGTVSIISMAAGVTLSMAKKYYLNREFTSEDPETGKETARTCLAVEELKGES